MENTQSIFRFMTTTLPLSIKNAARFSKRTVQFIGVGSGTIFFPIMVIVVGVNSFYYTHNKKMTASVRLRTIISTALFSIPVIGPVLSYWIINKEAIDCLHMIPKENMTIKRYLILSIPFVSSFFASVQIILFTGYNNRINKNLLSYNELFNNQYQITTTLPSASEIIDSRSCLS